MQSDLNDFDLVVIGGGISGLVAAKEFGAERTLVVEARDKLGGSIASVVIDGHLVDAGAEAVATTRHEAIELITELGLAVELERPLRSDARIAVETGLFQIPHGLLGIPSDLNSAEVVSLVGRAAVEEAIWRDALPWSATGEAVTLGGLVRQRLGDSFVDQILAPVIGGVHSADPDRLEVKVLNPEIIKLLEQGHGLIESVKTIRGAGVTPGAPITGLRGGLFRLVAALGSLLAARGVQFRLATKALGIEHDGKRWCIKLDPVGQVRASNLIIAIPPTEAANFFAEIPAVRESMTKIVTADVAIALLAVRSTDLDAAPVGSGVLVSKSRSDVEAKAMTHATAKWQWLAELFGPGRHLLRLSYGRDGRLPDDLRHLGEIAMRDARTLLAPASIEVVEHRVALWPNSLVQQRLGYQANIAELRLALSDLPNVGLVGSGLGGNGVAGVIRQVRECIAEFATAQRAR